MKEIGGYIMDYKQEKNNYKVYFYNKKSLKIPATKENKRKLLEKIDEWQETLLNIESTLDAERNDYIKLFSLSIVGLMYGIIDYKNAIPDFPLPGISTFLSSNFNIMVGVGSGILGATTIFQIAKNILLLKEVQREEYYSQILSLIKKLSPEIISETTKQQVAYKILALEKYDLKQRNKIKFKELKTTLQLLKRDQDLEFKYNSSATQELCLKK